MRTDNSPRRAVRRAICRFATLTQAIRSTNDTAPTSISSSVRTDSVPYACKPTVRAIVRASGTNAPACAIAPVGAIDGSLTSDVSSASARACVTPGFTRPNRKRNALLPGSPGQRLGRKMSRSGSAPIADHRPEAELRRQHADDGARETVDGEGLSDDPRIGLERRAPESIADDRALVVVRRRGAREERAAAGGTDAEHVEEIRTHLDRRHLHRLAASGELRVDRVVGRERIERGDARAQPLVRHGRPGPERLDARLGLLRRRDHDEALGIGIRQRTPEHAVGDGEDRGVEADAERERGEGGQGERRLAPHQSQRVTHVLRGRFDRRQSRSETAGCDSCWLAVGHAGSLDSAVLSARMRFSIYGRYVPARSIEGVCGC